VALAVNTDDPAFAWDRVRRAVAEALGAPVVATDDPSAIDRRGLLTVTWRPSRHELAVTYEDRRGIISRIVPAPDDVGAGVAAAASLAVNLARDQAAELLRDERVRASATPAAPPMPTEANETTEATTTTGRPPRMVLEEAPLLPTPAPARRWMVGLVAGTGIGWTTGSGDVNADARVKPGLAPALALQLGPEVGYHVTRRLLLSVAARLQLFTGTNDRHLMRAPEFAADCGGDFVCSSPRSAFAALAKATVFGGERDLRPYFSFALGGGTIRHTASFPTQKVCGPTGTSTCIDTVSAGPVLFGPGGGVRYRVASAVDLVAGLELLFAAPRFTFNVDVNAGAAVSF
jgi:hypothetical protein